VIHNNLKKRERITRRKAIETILSSGQTEFLFPFRVHWNWSGFCESHVKVAFSVPKKNFKKAVDRNLLKRRMREAFRTNKHPLCEAGEKFDITTSVFIIYTGHEIQSFFLIERKIKDVVQKLTRLTHEKNS
jgi:ribonuclease P protein component